MLNDHDSTGTATVELRSTDGVAFIDQGTPLTRLHYFDGQYLRAASLTLEQDYHRHAVRLGNLAGGWGVVHGLGVAVTGDELKVDAGLAVTPAGSFVLAAGELRARLADLLKVAAPLPPSGKSSFDDCVEPPRAGVRETPALGVYEITVGPLEGLCGNEPVYGKLCETACATDSSHPWWREGVVLRLRPVTLALPTSDAITPANVHLRNRIASAYFAAEPWLVRSLLSASGLASGVWCGPAVLYGRDEVVVGLLAREGTVVRVIDAWSGRRERMDAQARGYWQGRMAMRPWNVFVAQILQFQCQLSGLFDADHPVIQPSDDCDRLRDLLGRTRKDIEALLRRYGDSTKKILLRTEGRPTNQEFVSVATEMNSSFAELDGLSLQLADAESGKGALPQNRMLLGAGFFELPPAGYLPVAPDADVEEQVRRMFGEGVDLAFHSVRSDEIAHLVEEAQHMRRISLTHGLDHRDDLEPVEVFVPDGDVRDAKAAGTGTWWQVAMVSGAWSVFSVLAPKKGVDEVEVGVGVDVVTRPRAKARTKARAAAAAPARGLGVNISNPGLLDLGSPKADSGGTATLDGLVRTESRQDGSSALTLVVANDSLQDDRAGGDDGTTGTKEFTGLETRGRDTAAGGRLGLYVAADVAADPFDLPVGGEAMFDAEIRRVDAMVAFEISVHARFTVVARRATSSGVEERQVQFDLQVESGTQQLPPESTRQKVTLVLQRDGDADSGRFVVDDEGKNRSTPPVIVDWHDAPRRAQMSVQLVNFVGGLVANIGDPLRSSAPPRQAPARALEFDVGQKDVQSPSRLRLLGMDALPDMPAPTSNLGVAAMSTLSALAEMTDDAAFLMRARRRLFPSLDAPKTVTVSAVHDWVMFRRARTALCGPACTRPPVAVLEAFQVWHLGLKSKDQESLGRLAKALERGDERTLAHFEFRRVGILRYRDESAYSEEPAARVVAMWKDAQPGKQVVLGRAWEAAPETGQGWQNHMRLQHMAEQIAELTEPPVPGSGALAVIPPPPGRLADATMDGGMLLVTVTRESQSRSALLIHVGVDGHRIFNSGSPQGSTQFDDDVPQGNSLQKFIADLTPNQGVRGVALATLRAEPDEGARRRLDAVADALKSANLPGPVTVHPPESLSVDDRREFAEAKIDLDRFDEVIFFQRNE